MTDPTPSLDTPRPAHPTRTRAPGARGPGRPAAAPPALAAPLALVVGALAVLAGPGPLAAQQAAWQENTATWEPPLARAVEFPLTIETIMRGPELVGSEPRAVRWTDDSRWIYFSWKPGGQPWDADSELYRVPAGGGEPEPVDEEVADSVGALFAGGDVSPDRTLRVTTVRGDLYLVDRRTLAVERLTETAAAERDPRFDAEGRHVFFRRGNDLFSLSLDGVRVRQLAEVRSGPADRDEEEVEGQRGFLEAQQEELFEHVRREAERREEREAEREAREAAERQPVRLRSDERLGGLTPDPRGRYAVLEAFTPGRGSENTIVPDWVTSSGYTETIDTRTKVGDVQGSSRMGLVALETGQVTWLDLDTAGIAAGRGEEQEGEEEGVEQEGEREGEEEDVVEVRGDFRAWTDDGTTGLIRTVTTDNKEWRLYALDAATGGLTLLDSHRDTAWVAGPCSFCYGWIPGTRRAWYVSEETGYAHVYTVDADGSNRRALTSGEWEARGVEIPEGADHFLVEAGLPTPFDTHLFRLDFDGGEMVQVTEGEGAFEATPSPDGRTLAVVHSRSNRPPELFVMANEPGAEIEQVTVSPTAEWLTFPWIQPEIVRIPARDGVGVPARIYRPSDVGARPNGAGVVFVHGAGYLHNVHHWWSSYYREYMFHHFLAANGYTVLDIDYRGSAGYGAEWRTAVYRHMGGQDLDDQVDGARWLVENEGVDPGRLGVYGGSYGGFITLMAMFTEPGVFEAGAALRSVTDWAHYNHPYTSRILNLPHEDDEAYRRSSPIYFAEGLEGHLLILHGMVDTNVHFSDVVRLAQRLIELGKEDWEFAVYPVEGHSFSEPTSWTDEYRRIFELFQEVIGPEGM